MSEMRRYGSVGTVIFYDIAYCESRKLLQSSYIGVTLHSSQDKDIVGEPFQPSKRD